MLQTDKASYYRERAAEARAVAMGTHFREIRATFLYIAESYEELACLHDDFKWPNRKR